MKTIEYEAPGDIDGDPQEVDAIVRAQLSRVLSAIWTVTSDSLVQIRNAHGSRVLRERSGATPEEIAAAWEESNERAGIDRVLTLIEASERAAADLREL